MIFVATALSCLCFLGLRLPLFLEVTHHERIPEDPDHAGLVTGGNVAGFEGVTVANSFAAHLVCNRREINKPGVMLRWIAPASSMEHTETCWFVFFLVAGLSQLSDFYDLGVDFIQWYW